MSARAEIDALIDRTDRDTSGSSSNIKQANLVGEAAFAGLLILAKHIDALSERLDGLDPKLDKDSVDVNAELADFRGQLKKLTKAVKKTKG